MGRLIFRDDEAGPRHYLDGRPVHCGTALDVRPIGEAWLLGRYETSGRISDDNAYFYLNDDRAIGLDAVAEVRWPEGGAT